MTLYMVFISPRRHAMYGTVASNKIRDWEVVAS